MDSLKSINPSELVIIGTLLTFLISDDNDAGDLNVLGNLIVSIGSLVLTWAAQKELQKTSNTENTNSDSLQSVKDQINELKKKYDMLEKSLSSQKNLLPSKSPSL